ncbi:MAG: protein translocase subunit SecF, partial [Candidatus Aminicenantes bacterium]|nr:protein translocase subunit SecF [Candidatus Aminicenantes bacterium]
GSGVRGGPPERRRRCPTSAGRGGRTGNRPRTSGRRGRKPGRRGRPGSGLR